MPLPNLPALSAVAERLDPLGIPYAFVGGSIVNLLVDDPQFAPARPTDDVDVIIQVLATERYSAIEQRLRDSGFDHDMTQGAPRCRWRLGRLVVDIMPTEGAHMGLNTTWFKEVLATATVQEFQHRELKLVSPLGFLVTKITAFQDRGENDYFGSHDFEDIITVIDGRADVVAEIDQGPPALRRVAIEAFRRMSAERNFDDALLGNLDTNSDDRLPILRRKIRGITRLAD